MNEYRCTRRRPYPKGTPGFTDPGARQGYYIRAESESEALAKMHDKFPREAVDGFDVSLWCENVDRKAVRPAAEPMSYIIDWLRSEQSINKAGDPGTIQRLVYLVPRAQTANDWTRVRKLSEQIHDSLGNDTGISLLLNALGCALERVEKSQTAAMQVLGAEVCVDCGVLTEYPTTSQGVDPLCSRCALNRDETEQRDDRA